MKTSIEKAIALSEVREKLNALNGISEPTDTQKGDETTLLASQKTLESEYREALKTESEEESTETVTQDAETRERLELRSKARVADYFTSALTRSPLAGASAEYSEAMGVPGAIPLSLLQEPEVRDVDSPAPSTHPTSPDAVTGFAYSRPVREFIGVDVVNQPGGDAAYPRVTTALTGGMVSAGAAGESTAAALTVVKHAADRRLQTRLTLRIEDLTAYPAVEAALKQNLLQEQESTRDAQILTGNDTAPNLDGLTNQVTVSTEGTDTTFDLMISKVASLIDGHYAADLKSVRLLVNANVAKWMVRTFRGTAANGGPVESLWTYLSRELGGLRASNRMPSPVSNVSYALAHRMAVPGRLGVMTSWGGLTIEDVFSSSKSGIVNVTMVEVVQGVGVLRENAWKALSIKTG